MSTLIADTASSFKSELQSKQSLIDQTHAKLRETSSLLASERRRLALLRQKANERKERRQRIANLYRNNKEQLALLSAPTTNPRGPLLDPRPDIKIGEADAGLEIDTTILPPSPESSQIEALTPAQREYLASLPPADVLLARVSAYKKNNSKLQAQTKSLKSRSSELESQLRKIVALCTGVQEDSVDGMIGALVAAVESEREEDVEMGRVREFLRRVEGAKEE